MCNENNRWWFSACSRGSGRMVHIVSARSIERVRAFYGPLSNEYIIEQLTWADLSRLAGIAPPTVEQDTTLAEGHLLFEYNGGIVSIEVAD